MSLSRAVKKCDITIYILNISQSLKKKKAYLHGHKTLYGYFKIRKVICNTYSMIPFIPKIAETEVNTYTKREEIEKIHTHQTVLNVLH